MLNWRIFALSVLPAFRNFNLNDLLSTGVNSVGDTILTIASTLLWIWCSCGVLHILNSVFFRKNLWKFKECWLKNSINSVAKTDFFTNLNTVDCIELNIVVSDILLNLTVGRCSSSSSAFHEQLSRNTPPRLNVLNHIVLSDIWCLVTSNKVSLVD